MKEKSGIVPGLATILVGQRPESTRYVAIKQAVARSAGFTSMLSEFRHTVQEDEILVCLYSMTFTAAYLAFVQPKYTFLEL